MVREGQILKAINYGGESTAEPPQVVKSGGKKEVKNKEERDVYTPWICSSVGSINTSCLCFAALWNRRK